MNRHHFIFSLMAVLVAVIVLFFATACRTDYTDSAVVKAREYALKNISGLTEEQRDFILFTQPLVYENLVFPRYVNPLNINGHIEADNVRYFPVTPEHDLMHSCFVWAPPGLGAKVVVAGEGERSMIFWKPYRVMLKTFYPGQSAREAALSAAASYVQNNMLYLTKPEMNRARYTQPKVLYTKFEILPELDALRPASVQEIAAYRNNPKKLTQISLAWESYTPGQVIVVTGFSETGTLAGWQLKTGELMSEEKLKGVLMTDAEIAAIEKEEELQPELVFKQEPEVIRNPYDTASNPNALTGGSFVFK